MSSHFGKRGWLAGIGGFSQIDFRRPFGRRRTAIGSLIRSFLVWAVSLERTASLRMEVDIIQHLAAETIVQLAQDLRLIKDKLIGPGCRSGPHEEDLAADGLRPRGFGKDMTDDFGPNGHGAVRPEGVGKLAFLQGVIDRESDRR